MSKPPRKAVRHANASSDGAEPDLSPADVDAWEAMRRELEPFNDPSRAPAAHKAARERADASRQQHATTLLAAARAELEQVAEYVRMSTIAVVAAAAVDDAVAGWADDLKAAAVAAAVPVWRARMEGGLDILDGKFTGVRRRADAEAVHAMPAVWLALRRADADRLLAEMGSAVRLIDAAEAERTRVLQSAGAATPSPVDLPAPAVDARHQRAGATLHRTGGRRPHILAAVIAVAQDAVEERGGDPWEPTEVWAQLLGMAIEAMRAIEAGRPNPHPPLLDDAGEREAKAQKPSAQQRYVGGIRYANGRGDGSFTQAALREYLRKRRPS